MDGTLSPHTWHQRDPRLGTAPVAIEPYVSLEFFERERERIFKNTWINVCREDWLPNPGDYFVRELKVARTSIVVIRGKDRRVRAFHNMCSHRGNQVAWEEKGSCKGFLTCKFHGWVYDTEGRLVHVTDEDHFFGVDKAGNGLASVHCDVWQGFVFVHLGKEPRESLAAYMAPVTERVDGYPFDQMHRAYCYKVEENVNWKTACEAQDEGWHLPFLHDRTLAKTAVDEGQLLRHAALIPYGRHCVISSHAPKKYKPSPTAAVAFRYGAGAFDAFAVEDKSDAKGPKWHGAFDLYHVFPNFFVGLLRGTYITYNFWPLAVDRTIWEVSSYYPKAESAGQLFSQEFGKCGLRDTLMEDAFTHEKIQAVIGSGAKTHFHLQDEEHAIRHFYATVQEFVNGIA